VFACRTVEARGRAYSRVLTNRAVKTLEFWPNRICAFETIEIFRLIIGCVLASSASARAACETRALLRGAVNLCEYKQTKKEQKTA